MMYGRAPAWLARARPAPSPWVAIVGLVLVVASTQAHAQIAAAPSSSPPPVLSPATRAPADRSPARRYATRSVSMLLGADVGVSPLVPGRASFGGGVRFVGPRCLAIELRLGGVVAFSVIAASTELGVQAGAGLGCAIAVSRRVALTPMVGYDAYAVWDLILLAPTMVHRLAAHVPVTWFVDDRAFVEFGVVVGAAWVIGRLDLAVELVPRIGVVF